MNVDLLSKMVKELILDNEKVALPGLGVFVAEMEPSTFSDRGYTINPPYRRLYFRTREEDNSLLRDFYAESNGIDKELAGKILDDFLNELKIQLKLKKNIILPGLGKLRATKENNVFFVADESLDIYPDGFGLEPISLKTHQEKEEDVAEALINLKTMIDIPEAGPSEDEVQDEIQDEVQDEAVPAGEMENGAEAVIAVCEEPVSAHDGNEDLAVVVKEGLDRKWKTAIIVLVSIVIAAALFMIIFLVLAQACPDFIDSILYNEEELEILNY